MNTEIVQNVVMKLKEVYGGRTENILGSEYKRVVNQILMTYDPTSEVPELVEVLNWIDGQTVDLEDLNRILWDIDNDCVDGMVGMFGTQQKDNENKNKMSEDDEYLIFAAHDVYNSLNKILEKFPRIEWNSIDTDDFIETFHSLLSKYGHIWDLLPFGNWLLEYNLIRLDLINPHQGVRLENITERLWQDIKDL